MVSSSFIELETSRAMAMVRGRLDARLWAVDKVRHAVEVLLSKVLSLRFTGKAIHRLSHCFLDLLGDTQRKDEPPFRFRAPKS